MFSSQHSTKLYGCMCQKKIPKFGTCTRNGNFEAFLRRKHSHGPLGVKDISIQISKSILEV